MKNHPTEWKDSQSILLTQLINSGMEKSGYVDLAHIAGRVGRTVESCRHKAGKLGLKYRYITGTVRPQPVIAYIKGDMNALPDHKDGREVWYE